MSRPAPPGAAAYDPRLSRTPWVTLTLCVALGIAWLATTFAGRAGVDPETWLGPLALLPRAPRPWTLLTSSLLHANLLHLVGNLAPLWLLGAPLEARIGHGRFAWGLAITAVASNAAFALARPQSNLYVIGSSGVVAAVLSGHLVLCIGQRWRPLAPLGLGTRPALATRLLALCLLPLFLWRNDPGAVAHEAHLAGLAIGIVLGFVARARMGPRGDEERIDPQAPASPGGRA